MVVRQLSVVRTENGLVSAEIANVSQGGISFSTQQPVGERGTVQLCCPGVLCLAEFQVVHRRASGSRFFTGARLRLAGQEQEKFLRYLRFHARRSA